MAEGSSEYCADVGGAAALDAPREKSWPAFAELVALGRKLDAAVERLDRGRWAAGDRTARQVIGSLARRHDWARAARGAAALADALVRRGRPSDAMALLTDAREYLDRSPRRDDTKEIARRITLTSGSAWTDLAELAKAEPLLRAAAEAETEVAADGRAHLMLGRCLFWRGEYDDARRVLSAAAERGGDAQAAARVTATALLARVLAALDDRSAATVVAAAALREATALAVPAVTSTAASACAFAHLAAGQLEAVAGHVAASVAAARAAHNPMLALKARLIDAEAARRCGRGGAAAALVGRVQRFGATSLAPIVRARLDLLRDLITTSNPDLAIARSVASSGLPALAIFAPRPGVRQASRQVPVEDALEIVTACDGQDEAAALGRVCAVLRRQLAAAGVGVFSFDARQEGRPRLVASDGRIDAATAAHLVTEGAAIRPRPAGDRVESGTLVRAGGRDAGVLVCRWPPSADINPDRVAAAITLASAVAGPVLASAAVHRQVDRADDDFTGASPALGAVRRIVERAAAAPFAVLIHGESGTGKELVARALHRRSPRRARPFCAVNCAALPDDLVESELFGHARGAFTGAVAERCGVFEEAHGGTLFLDEVGELSPRAQAKVLRAIQEGEIRRVGENALRRIDVRIVAATNRSLKEECEARRFRLDLLYRLDVIHIDLLPLRLRRDDIMPLVDRYWRDACARVGSRATLSAAALAALARYDWPGNVRELQNVLAALAVAGPRRGVILPSALPGAVAAAPEEPLSLDAARRAFEARFVADALLRHGGHRVRAARELGLSRQGLTKLMTRLRITER